MAQSSTPELPRQWAKATYPTPSGRSVRVEAWDDLQAALNAAQPGDEIVLTAGASYVGNFVLPNFSGGNWVTVCSSEMASLPQEQRVTPEMSGALPKLLSPNSHPALETQPGAHYWRFTGIEFSVTENVKINYGIVVFGADSTQRSEDTIPSDLILDRCFIHGNEQGEIFRGVALNSRYTSIVDCYVSDCHSTFADAQAIAGWNGPGPFQIVNNYLEATGENVLFGGADPSIPGLVPSDIEFRNNLCSKPLSWKAGEVGYKGIAWSVKNLFELKNARRVWIDNNIFENNWSDAQNGFAILMTVRNQDGGAPWSVVEDVTFTNNFVRHTAGGINILGRDNLHPSQQARRLLFRNNRWEDISLYWGVNQRFLQISATAEVVFDGNFVQHAGNIITASEAPNTSFVFINNQMNHNDYGVVGDGTGIGKHTLETYFPGAVFSGNTLFGGPEHLYPPGNYFPVASGM